MIPPADRAALLATLRPWIERLALHNSSCELVNPSRIECGVRFRFSVVFQTLEARGNDAVCQVREAIDVVYRILSLDTALVFEFHEMEGYTWSMVRGVHNAPVKRALERDLTFEMEITIVALQFEEAVGMKRLVGDQLLVHFTESASSDASYVAAKAALDALLEKKNPQWAEALRTRPIRVRCRLESAQCLDWSYEEAEDLFQDLNEFARTMETAIVPASTTAGHLPVSMDIVSTNFLSPPPITPQVVRSVEEITGLQRVGLHCSSLPIDPRLVTCSRAELASFLQAITKNVPNPAAVQIFSGRSANRRPIPMDGEVAASVRIPDLLFPIAECETVGTLRLGSLFDLYQSPHSRGVIVQVLLETMLVRAKPMNLSIEDASVNAIDAQLLTTLVRQWRAQNPEAKLRLKRLTIDLYGESHAYADALVAALDEAEEISFISNNPNAPPNSSEQVVFLLTRFPMLRAVSLTKVVLESMHAFMGASPPALESIELRQLVLRNRPSLLEFLEALGVPEQPLARRLRRFRIHNVAFEGPTCFQLTEPEVECLARALESNRVLEKVSVTIGEPDVMKRVPQMVLLGRTKGLVIPAAPDIRHSTEEKDRRLAFMSIFHHDQGDLRSSEKAVLDAVLMRRVFEFSDAWAERSVDVM